MSRYRLVNFVPALSRGERFPMGALVETSGRVSVVRSHRIPHADCLGGLERQQVYRLAQNLIFKAEAFDRLPRSLNGLAVLDSPVPIPTNEDAVAWVQAVVFPKPADSVGDGIQKRATQGYAALKDSVAGHGGDPSWIRKTFKPGTDGPPWFRSMSSLPTVSHWVGGENHSNLLLLEPIVLDRPSLSKDLKNVAMVLGAYRSAKEHFHHEQVQISAYLAGSDPKKVRREVVRELDVFADCVYDLAQPSDQEQITRAMRRVVHEGMAEAR